MVISFDVLLLIVCRSSKSKCFTILMSYERRHHRYNSSSQGIFTSDSTAFLMEIYDSIFLCMLGDDHSKSIKSVLPLRIKKKTTVDGYKHYFSAHRTSQAVIFDYNGHSIFIRSRIFKLRSFARDRPFETMKKKKVRDVNRIVNTK